VIHNLTQAGTGVIITSHDSKLISKLIDIVYFLEEGRIVESYDRQGKEILQQDGKIYHYHS